MVCLLCFTGLTVKGQKGPLLLDLQVQIEATEAVNNLYNFEFEAAQKEFNWFRYKYANNPMPYFLLGFAEWWKMMPNPDNKKYDKTMIAYMDTCMYYCDKLFEKDEKDLDAIFFKSAASGFLGRIYADRKKWSKSTFAGKNALKYINMGRDYLDMSPEFSFGDGLINYYLEWIRENYVMLRPVLMFFPDGDKKLGISQLEKASNTAFYTRTEAQYWLMYIYAVEENDTKKAFPIAEYLHQTYPQNAYFSRYYARLSWLTGRYEETEKTCYAILKGIEDEKVGYEEVTGRYAAYYLGYIHQFKKHDSVKAKQYFKMCIDFAEAIKAYDSGYYKYSHVYLARIAAKEDHVLTAKRYYKKYIKVEKNRKDKKFKEAKAYIKKN